MTAYTHVFIYMVTSLLFITHVDIAVSHFKIYLDLCYEKSTFALNKII